MTQLELFSEPTSTGVVGNLIYNTLDELIIKIKKLHPDAIIPKYAKDGDAAMDLVATDMVVNETISRIQITYHTGLSVEIPKGYVGLIFARSSVNKTFLRLSNSVGVIDSGYRGELMLNFTVQHNPLQPGMWKQNIYNIGDRVGQLMILPYPSVRFTEVEELSQTERGDGGFGSTGK